MSDNVGDKMWQKLSRRGVQAGPLRGLQLDWATADDGGLNLIVSNF